MFLTVGRGRGGGAIFTCKHFVFLYAAPAANNFFVCLRLPAHTLFFTSIQFISVFTASANNIS